MLGSVNKIIIKLEFVTVNLSFSQSIFHAHDVHSTVYRILPPEFLQATHFCHIPKPESTVFSETSSFILF